MTPTSVGIGLLIAALACLYLAWRNLRGYTKDLDRAGRTFGVERWDGEPNYHYERRIRDRIIARQEQPW